MQFYNLHTHKFTNDATVLELVNQYPWEFDNAIPQYSIGIHPWYISEDRLASDLNCIEEKLRLKQCLALGECGLDKRIEVPMGLQIEVFEKQIALAEKYQKSLVLHLVAAFDELLEIKKRLKISVPIVIHGFSKNEQVAKQLIANGFYLSFGKYLLQNPEMKEVFQSIPNDRFFLETDTVEKTLEEVYSLAAEYKGMTLAEMKAQVERNWKIVF
ncbi:TatD family hydrolase [Flavobacterium sp. AS60]|uniref:TatD family hydrolase n=1 Tax=Flavobacterium anseongense TaxID=2910677 RepID=UPI001F393F14|nr:TatD family hydrolase [Flavobacterium sp. AS60]MCF6129474.1 TatD family hydrolase [Flavobacterium sp. AS60]